MNLHIVENNFGFRITADELNALLQGQDVEQRLCIGNHCFGYRITSARSDREISLEMAVGGFCLYVPRPALEQLRDLDRPQDGITITQNGVEVKLQIDSAAAEKLRKAA